MKMRYKYTRFLTEKNAWPPERSKHFTTLAFAYCKNEYTQEDVITLGTENIEFDDIVDSDSHFDGSTVTTTGLEWLNALEAQNVESCHPKTILVQGAPGMGKSFLLKHIAYLWATGQLLTSSRLLFLVSLRNPVVKSMSTVNQLVDLFCDTEARALHSSKICASHLFETGGENVTILLDGLDEIPEEMLSDDNCLVAKLLDCHALPACNIVVSSRPHASKYIRDNVILRVDIMGFTEDHRKSFIEKSLEGQEESAEKLLKYIHGHPNINSLCYVPFILTVLLFLFKKGYDIFNSSAELYNQFVYSTIEHHLTTKSKEEIKLNDLPSACNDIIAKLSKLSLEALSKNQTVFNLNEVKSACPEFDITPDGIAGLRLLQADDFPHSATTSSISFIHLSLQEFLAAYCVANLPPDEEMKILKQYFWSKPHLNMFSLYVGFTKGQHSSFKKFLSDDGKEVGIAKKFLTEQIKCFYLYQCFYEAGDEEVCRNISDAEVFSSGIIKLRGPLLPTEIFTLSLFLSTSHIKQWKTLELLSCNIRDVGCRIFHHTMTSHGCPPVIETIDLSSNLLTSASAQYISEIVLTCKTKELRLNGNNLQKTNALSTMLQNNTVIKELFIHGNNLHSLTAVNICKAINEDSQLKLLSLMHNDIDDEATDEIVGMLQTNKSLDALWINSNKLTKNAAQKIMHALSNNTTLRVLILPNNYSYETTKWIQKESNKINNNRKKYCNEFEIIELDIDFQ